MPPTLREIRRLAADTGFGPATLEKVWRLIEFLRETVVEPDLEQKLVLKGGTALNLARDRPRRLSVDLDFNYVGAADRQEMEADRPRVEGAIERIGTRLGLSIQKTNDAHAGRKFFFGYAGVLGTPDRIEVDLNYLHRVNLLPPRVLRMWSPDGEPPIEVPTVSDEELTAGKLCALLDRRAARDLWDVAHLPSLLSPWPPPQLRPIFVAFAGSLPHGLWTYSSDRVLAIPTRTVETLLHPMLLEGDRPKIETLQNAARAILEPLLDLGPNERSFSEGIQTGEIRAELLFPEDPELAERLTRSPILRWKAANARRHHDLRNKPTP